MANLNRCTIIGRLGADPESRFTQGGTHVCRFDVAVDAVPPKEHPERKHTEWFKVVAWAGLADVVEKYLSKGDLVYCDGELRTREYEVEGGRRFITELQLRTMQMLRTKPREQKEPAQTRQPGRRDTSQPPDFDDEIPF